MNKISEEICDADEVKDILGYRNRKTCAAAPKDKKKEETRYGQRERKKLTEKR